jgi:hypothetical protein
MDDREDMEQVPWHDLLVEAEPEDTRRRAMYLGAGLIGAMLVGIMVARVWWTAGAPPVPTAPGDTVVADGEADENIALPEVESPPLYSEADLMAYPTDPAEREAMVRAEWFVMDYFTADLDPVGSSDLRAALPEGAIAAPHPRDSMEGISYVEWARAFAIEAVADGSYLVSVAYRAMAAPADRGFTRHPVRAVQVPIGVLPGGGATVLDLPGPTMLPAGPEHLTIPEPDAAAPQTVLDAALLKAAAWGAEPRVVSAYRMVSDWRVVVTVADGAGNRWPLAVRVGEV